MMLRKLVALTWLTLRPSGSMLTRKPSVAHLRNARLREVSPHSCKVTFLWSSLRIHPRPLSLIHYQCLGLTRPSDARPAHLVAVRDGRRLVRL